MAPPTSEPTTDTSEPTTDSSSQVPTDSGVQLSAVAAQEPDAAVVQTGLTSYFEAINSHDWNAWLAAVQPSASEGQDQSSWLSGYRSTHDDQVVVTAISSSGNSLLADVSMRSVQDPADAPPNLPVGRICWTLTLPVDANSGKVGAAIPGNTSMAAC